MKKFAFVLVLALLVVAFSAQVSFAETPDQFRARTMQELFSKHSDFACVKSLPAFSGARNPTIDGLAQVNNLNADQLQCYYYTFLFDKDQNAMNAWDAKGHYFRAGRVIGSYDRIALYYRDLDAMAESLGLQVPFPFINPDTDHLFHRWQDVPKRITAE